VGIRGEDFTIYMNMMKSPFILNEIFLIMIIKVVFPMFSRRTKKYLFSPIKNFFVKSHLINNYSSVERKRQYTGWVEGFAILHLIQGNYRIYKEYTNPKDP
jgi:hypothetical protein